MDKKYGRIENAAWILAQASRHIVVPSEVGVEEVDSSPLARAVRRLEVIGQAFDGGRPEVQALRDAAVAIRILRAKVRQDRSSLAWSLFEDVEEARDLAVMAVDPGMECREDLPWVMSHLSERMTRCMEKVECGEERRIYSEDRSSSVGACVQTKSPRRIDGKYGRDASKERVRKDRSSSRRTAPVVEPGSAVGPMRAEALNRPLHPLAHQVAPIVQEKNPGEQPVIRRFARSGIGVHPISHFRLSSPMPVADIVRTGIAGIPVPVQGDVSSLPFGGEAGRCAHVIVREQLHVPQAPAYARISAQAKAAPRLPLGMWFLSR